MAIIINANREGYGTDQVRKTMTVNDLINELAQYNPETPVYIGNDRNDYGWYTYGGINEWDISEEEGEKEDGND